MTIDLSREFIGLEVQAYVMHILCFDIFALMDNKYGTMVKAESTPFAVFPRIYKSNRV